MNLSQNYQSKSQQHNLRIKLLALNSKKVLLFRNLRSFFWEKRSKSVLYRTPSHLPRSWWRLFQSPQDSLRFQLMICGTLLSFWSTQMGTLPMSTLTNMSSPLTAYYSQYWRKVTKPCKKIARHLKSWKLKSCASTKTNWCSWWNGFKIIPQMKIIR